METVFVCSVDDIVDKSGALIERTGYAFKKTVVDNVDNAVVKALADNTNGSVGNVFIGENSVAVNKSVLLLTILLIELVKCIIT